MRSVRAAVLAVLFVTVVVSLTAQNGDTYTVRLSPMPIEATTQATTTGLGSATAVLKGTTLTVSGTFSRLQGPATLAQIHVGPRGIPGPPVFDLAVTRAASGTVQGELTLSAAQVDHLKRGRLYIQIHSDKAPDGNLRGWLLQ